MKFLILLLAASGALRFDVVDGRGRKAAGVVIEASDPDADGWCQLSIAKSKRPAVIVWPFDGRAKAADGPGAIPVIVLENGTPPTGPSGMAALMAGELLGGSQARVPEGIGLISGDSLAGGVALLYGHKAAEAIGPLGRALSDRERQLTRVPSEIYAAAMLYGRALLDADKFDEAAVAFLKALKQRPSDSQAKSLRSEALIKAGKPDAAN